MTDFVIINIVLNGAFYIINFRNHKGALTYDMITSDLFIGLCILAIACPLAGFINIPKAINKGSLSNLNNKTSYLYNWFPKKLVLRSLMLTLFTVAFSYLSFVFIPLQMGVSHINHYIGFSVKVITVIIMSGFVGYVVLELTLSDYQLELTNQTKGDYKNETIKRSAL